MENNNDNNQKAEPSRTDIQSPQADVSRTDIKAPKKKQPNHLAFQINGLTFWVVYGPATATAVLKLPPNLINKKKSKLQMFKNITSLEQAKTEAEKWIGDHWEDLEVA